MKNVWKRFGKRIFSWLLCVALVVGLMPEMEMPRVKAVSMVGDGSKENPYMISNYAQLLEFAALVNGGMNDACAVLTDNIDASASAQGGNKWTPIGTNSYPYAGTFDGAGKTIKNLVINSSDSVYAGFFGYIGSKGKVKNLSLEDGSVSGKTYVGGIVGYSDGTIENCHNGADVRAEGSDTYVGGVVGFSSSGEMAKCYNTGTITATGRNTYIGGVTGQCLVVLSKCYNMGEITSTGQDSVVGGLVGQGSDVSECYNIGSITATGQPMYVGGLTGNGAVRYSFFDEEKCFISVDGVEVAIKDKRAIGSISNTSAGKLTTDKMTGMSAVENMGFASDTWHVHEDDGDEKFYPHLKGFAYDTTLDMKDWPEKPAVGYEVAPSTLTYNGMDRLPDIDIINAKDFTDIILLDASEYKILNLTEAINAGTYSLRYMILSTGAYGEGSFEIKKVSAPSTISDKYKPVAKTGLAANGSEQALLTSPSAPLEGYTIEYSTDGGENWSTDVPTGKEAKEYAVFVRYFGDQNHEDFDGESLTVTISAALPDGIVWNADENRYEISNYAGLKAFADIVNGTAPLDKSGMGNRANAKLMSDIDASASATAGNEWVPIGTNYKYYYGTFDGDNHAIKNLVVNMPDSDCVGLFGYVGENGTVQNLSLIGGSVIGKNMVGGIVGYNLNDRILNCRNDATVSGEGRIGGVVGTNNGGEVQDCHNTGTLTSASKASSFIGGIVGDNVGGKVEYCYNEGAIAVTGDGISVGGIVGGIVGFGDKDAVDNCYNAGAISVTGNYAYVGGIVGTSQQKGTIGNCYNAGMLTVQGYSAKVGGIAVDVPEGTIRNVYNIGAITITGDSGIAYGVTTSGSSDTVTNGYFDKEKCVVTVNGKITKINATSTPTNTGTVKGLTTAEMTGEKALENMGFDTQYWYVHANDADGGRVFYPHLKGFAYDDSQSVADWPARVCYIDSYAKLKTFADIVNGRGNYAGKSDPGVWGVLTADIECKNDPSDEEYATDWYPIADGTGAINNEIMYTGVFDGRGHVIKGLNNADYRTNKYSGLFGEIAPGGIVRNVGLEYVNVFGAICVGGIAGHNKGTIANCHVSGTISGTRDHYIIVGGVAGYNVGSSCKAVIANSYFTGTVNAFGKRPQVGGVVGNNLAYDGGSAFVENCYSVGTIIGNGTIEIFDNYVGGVLGSNYGYNEGKAEVTNCYHIGEVIATGGAARAGGVAGQNWDSAIVTNCYHVGAVTASGDNAVAVGVIAVYNVDTVTDCYFDSEKSVITINGQVAKGNDIKAMGNNFIVINNVKGLTTADMTGANALTNMGFSTDDWYAHANDDSSSNTFYPHLKGFAYASDDINEPDVADWVPRVCYISNYAQLKAFADLVNGTGAYQGKGDQSANAILMADIDCKYNASDAEYAKDWTPIGKDSGSVQKKGYKGVFDGQGHIIVGLNHTNDGALFAGLFGIVGKKGVVKNLGLEEFSVNGSKNVYVGGVAAYNYGTIQNCYNSGKVNVSYSSGNDDEIFIGGVAGYNDGSIERCYNAVEIYGEGPGVVAGGVAGLNWGKILSSYNIQSIAAYATSSGSTVGGVAGDNKGEIQNCYSIQSVKAKNYYGTPLHIGGVVGKSSGEIQNCFYDLNVCGKTGAVDGKDNEANNVKGLTTEEMVAFGLEAWFKPEDSQETSWLFAEEVKDDAEGKIIYYYPHLKGFNLTDDGKQMDAKDIVKAGEWPAYTKVDAPKYEITVIAASNTGNVYDGEEKTAKGFLQIQYEENGEPKTVNVEGQSEPSFTLDGTTYTISGLTTSDPKSKTVCNVENVITGTAVVKDAGDNDVTDQFTVSLVNGALEIKQSTTALVITSETKSWTYDGELHFGETYVVKYGGNEVAADQTTDPKLAGKVFTLPTKDKITITSWAEGVQNYDETYSQNNTFTYVLENGDQYNGTITINYGTLSITPAEIVIQADDKEKIYDNDTSTDPKLTATVLNKPENGVAVNYTLSRDPGQDVKNYEIKVTTGSNPNYAVTTGNGKFQIRQREVSVSVEDKTVEYDGGELYGNEACTFSNVVSGHTATITYTPAKGTLVNTYTGSFGNDFSVVDGEGNNVTGNYKLTVKTAGKLIIGDRKDKYEITVVANSSTGNVYDGTEKSVSGFEKLTFQVNGKTYAVEGLSTSDPKLTAAGTAANEVSGTAVVKDSAGNDMTAQFAVTTQDGALEIVSREVSVSVEDAAAEYNGSEQYGKAEYAFTNVVSGQTATITYTPAKGTLAQKEAYVGSFTDGTFKVTDAAGNNVTDNYDLTTMTAGKLTISDRTNLYEITVVAKSSTGNVYDGTEKGVSGFETLEFTVDGNDYVVEGLTTSDPSGTDICNLANAISGTAVVKDAAGNDVTAQFAVTTQDGALEIVSREVTVSVADKNFEYNGNEQYGSEEYLFANVVGGQTATITYVPAKGTLVNTYDNGSFVDGTFQVTNGAGNDVTGNYNLMTLTAGKLTVKDRTNKYEITVVAASSTGNVYDGTEKTVSGFETLDFTVDGNDYVVEGLTTSNPSGTDICNLVNVISGTAVVKDAAGNDVTAQFAVSMVNGTLEIKRREVTVSVSDKSVEYNGNEQYGNAEYSFTDVVSGQTASITYVPAKGKLARATAYDNGSFDKGTFKVTDGAGNDLTLNYELTAMTAGKLTVNDRKDKYEITVTANGSTGNVYDGTAKSASGFEKLTFQVEGNDYAVSGLTTSDPSGTDVCSLTNAVSGTAVVKDAEGNDVTAQFSVSTVDGTLEIKQREVTVSASDKSVEYNGNEQSGNAEYAFMNVVSGQTATITYVPAKGRLVQTYDNGSFDKDTFKVTDAAGNDVTGNYDLTAMTAGKLTVTDRTEKYVITVKSNGNAGNVYDGTEKKAAGIENLKFTVEGNEYTVEGLYSHDPSSTNVCNLANVILGTAVVKDAENNDVTAQFEVRKAEGRLEIKPRPATITVDSKRKELRNPDPKFTATVTGLVDGDVLDYELVREEGEEPGTYAITAKVTADENYDVTVVDGMLIINEDYLNDLRKKLQEAISRGGEQTVTWNKGTALPYDVMKTLEDHPQITLIFSYSYQGTDYRVTIPGKSARAYTTISWYGPLYLNDIYNNAGNKGGNSNLGSRVYKVVKGDCLSRIARRLGLKWRWLANFNNLKNPNRIYPGQELRY